MAFKSKAQRRKFAELLVKGEISGEVFERWNRDTGKSKLPEHAAAKKSRAPKRASKSRSGATPARSASGKAATKARARTRK